MRVSLRWIGVLCVLGGCSPSPSSGPGAATSTAAAPSPTALPPPPAQAVSCAAQIGAEAAQRLVEQCIAVSPATHPPCNVANSCALIEAEIERSCALFADSDPLPAGLCQTPAGAARDQTPAGVVTDYYAAIAAHDFSRAYSLWRDGGRASGKSLADFTSGFAQTATVEVETGAPSAPDGAAGSTYVTVPVKVRATTRDGAAQRFTGSYVLRRVNDVPGATADQLAWHIHSASLAPAN